MSDDRKGSQASERALERASSWTLEPSAPGDKTSTSPEVKEVQAALQQLEAEARQKLSVGQSCRPGRSSPWSTASGWARPGALLCAWALLSSFQTSPGQKFLWDNVGFSRQETPSTGLLIRDRK